MYFISIIAIWDTSHSLLASTFIIARRVFSTSYSVFLVTQRTRSCTRPQHAKRKNAKNACKIVPRRWEQHPPAIFPRSEKQSIIPISISSIIISVGYVESRSHRAHIRYRHRSREQKDRDSDGAWRNGLWRLLVRDDVVLLLHILHIIVPTSSCQHPPADIILSTLPQQLTTTVGRIVLRCRVFLCPPVDLCPPADE